MASASIRKGILHNLQWLNFFAADLQAGIGPFLGVFLLSKGWVSGQIGLAMTMGGIAGMLVTVPAGALIDSAAHKTRYLIFPGICILLASALLLISQQFWMVSASQVATAIAGAAIGPAIIAVTLGIVKQQGFNRQNGYNQAFNHAGNVAGAALSGFAGMRWGLGAILVMSCIFGLLFIVSALLIPSESIDNRAARGLPGNRDNASAGSLGILLRCKPLLILSAALALFHLGNGAMLPLYGMAAAANKSIEPSMFVAMTIIVAQVVMIATSIIAMRTAEKKGYWLVILISFISLPVRGFIASRLINHVGLYPVQALDGIGAGLQSVAVPGLVAHILNGTGRVNAGQGAVMTIQGIGAALSPAIGGYLAQEINYSTSFMILGSFALGSLAIWLAYAPTMNKACAQPV